MTRTAKAWRIVFMGTPAFAVPSLERLARSDDSIVAVFSQPDRPAGRGHRPVAPAVKQRARDIGLPVLQPKTLRDPTVHAELARLAPDAIVVAAYGLLLPPTVLDLPPQGCINVHASLLPRHRGAAPIQWAILCGDSATGITIMQMNEAMDEGDILSQRAIDIEPRDTSETLGTKLADLGASVLTETIEALKCGRIDPQEQEDSLATLAPRIRKSMGRIDWGAPADAIERAVRAFQPWPSAYTTLDGKNFKILASRVAGGSSRADRPGTVLASEGGRLRVAAGGGSLEIESVQLEGHRRLPVAEFLRGHPVPPGTVLG